MPKTKEKTMCFCTPGIRTPYCNSIECQKEIDRMKKENNKQEAIGNVSELSDLLDGLIPAKELIKIAFPECSKQCAAVDYFGVCECESVCPQKFDEAGRAINI